MQPLTARLLRDFPYTQEADPGSLKRGRDYHKEGRVEEVELLDDHTAICTVMGNSGDYEVGIQSEDSSPGGLLFTCDCPYADDGNFCKHMIAAALELTEFLAADEVVPPVSPMPAPPPARALSPAPPAPARSWQNQLNLALASGAPRSNPVRVARFVGLVILDRLNAFGYSYNAYTAGLGSHVLTPYVIPVADWSALMGGAVSTDSQAINALLESDRRWIRVGRPLTQTVDPGGCLNLDPDAVAFLNLLVSLQRIYYALGAGNLPMLLAVLAKLDVPVFLGSITSGKLERRLRIRPAPVDVTFDLRQTAEGLSLLPGREQDGQFRPILKPVIALTRYPVWAVVEDEIVQLRPPEMLEHLNTFPFTIPPAEVDAFRDKYLVRMAQTLPFRSGAIQWREVRADPVPRLYLRDDKESGLCAELRFGYGEYEVPAAKSAEPAVVATPTENWELVRIHRQGEREAGILQDLAGPAHGLKRAVTKQPYGTLALRARVHPFDFLLHEIPRLTQAGFEVYGEDTLKVGKINRHTPRLQVTVTSGLDWFDLGLVVQFGDQQILLQAVRKALQRGERFVKLADGSAGQIPAEWLEKYRQLWNLATETEAGLRVADHHLPLLDTLLEDDPGLQVPPDLLERRDRLRSFEQITPQPLGRNFVGELRPYQKHGVDWLHFLHEFKFGGILADDMGLGKTVQVLAFFQLLKERSPQAAASLLVVPKSLIANWQREAAKFTPDLRLLQYLGQVRSKDAAGFTGYDFVLTTYGTLLRDIDSLRHYRFQYVVLDESQAIKNPLAKSAKAARLLQAEHRLVLTGTPVENNTVELWSQFAFVNPGLLGSLDYFRQEFAIPIESRGDAAAAATLRKLIYPFILRRTKAQVAPELPPRTERIIYADMNSAQKKLYVQTRDRYRAELLGLIESQGLNDARFKILEGLLRLRQIAIHPGLVDARYAGAAPKLEILLETLETLQAENHKALIFSQFVGVLKYVRRELEARQLTYVYLDGQTPDRQARVDLFQNDPACRFFLISLKAGGVGLNLTAAEYVIHLDPWWNPAVEMQASDRAHRIGQDKPVFIYKLIARDTVEEKILQLQEKKRALVTNLVTTEAGFFKSLTRDDVSLLFG